MRAYILLAMAAPLMAFSPTVPQLHRASAPQILSLKAQEHGSGGPQLTRAQVLKFGLGVGAWGLSGLGAEAQGLSGLRKMVTGEEAGKERAAARMQKKEESACDIYKCIEVSNEDVNGALARTQVYEMSFMAPVKWEKSVDGDTTSWKGPGGATVTLQKTDSSMGIKDVPAGTPPAMGKTILDFSKAQAGIKVGKMMGMENTGAAARYIKAENVPLYTFGFKNEEATSVVDVMPYKGNCYILTAQCPTAEFQNLKILFSSMLASVSFAA